MPIYMFFHKTGIDFFSPLITAFIQDKSDDINKSIFFTLLNSYIFGCVHRTAGVIKIDSILSKFIVYEQQRASYMLMPFSCLHFD